MKKFLSVFLCVAMLLSFAVVSFAAGETATLVTNASSLKAGDQIVIMDASGNFAMGTQGNNIRNKVDAVASNGQITVTADMAIVTLEAGQTEGTFALKTAEGYMSFTGTKNQVHVTDDKTDASANWTITIEDGVATVANVATPARMLQYNASSPRFACYTSAQVKLGIYKLGAAGTTPETPVDPKPEEPAPEEPKPETPSIAVVETPVAGTAYKFGMVQPNAGNKTYYLVGGMSGYYMATSEDANAAIDVYLEATEGGFYFYTMVDGVKTYINMVVSGTHVNGAYEATASTVYTYDATSKTLIATVNDAPYWFGTRNDKNYTTVGPCATSYNGFYCQFYAAASAPVDPKPEEPKPEEPTPEEPKVELAVIADGTYVIVFDGKAVTAVAADKSYGYLGNTAVTVAGGVVTDYTDANLITITNVEGGFMMQDAYGRYLYMTGTYNSYNMSKEIPAEGHIWQAQKVDGGVVIINVLKQKTMAFDASYNTFGAYANKSSVVNVIAIQMINQDQVAADAVIAQINAIGTVTKDSEEAIKVARAAYEALTDAQKALVTNLETLTAAEKALEELQKPVEPEQPEQPANGNMADFDTIVLPSSKPNGDSSYTGQYTTANGWTTENSAIQCGGATVMNPQYPVIGADNTSKAVCLNGKVSAPGKITSPVLTGGISSLTLTYTKMFTDVKLGVIITITDMATGKTYTHTISREVDKTNDKYVVWTEVWVLETPISGNFTIEVVNSSPSAGTGNTDRFTVLDLTWESGPKTPDVPVENPDQIAADAVIAQINAIGTVDLTSEEAIKVARAAYEALTDAQKALVTNVETLTAAESALQKLQDEAAQLAADQAAAKAVIAQINAIGTVDLTSEEAIKVARAAYEALTDAQKALVTNVGTLIAAESALQKLQDEAAQLAADQAAAKAVEALINAIGTVTKDSKEAIEAARAAYEALTDAQKALVTNLETLTAAESAFAGIKPMGEQTALIFVVMAMSLTALVVLISKKKAF